MDEKTTTRRIAGRALQSRSISGPEELVIALGELARIQRRPEPTSERLSVALDIIGRAMHAGRVTLFEFHHTDTTTLVVPTSEWRADGVVSTGTSASLASIPLDDLGLVRWRTEFEHGVVLSGDMPSFPQSEQTYFVLRSCAFGAFCGVPASSDLFGFLAIEYFRDPAWEDAQNRDFLSAASSLIGGILVAGGVGHTIDRIHDELYEIRAMRTSMAEEIDELKEWKGQLFSSFAHEFQTPLYTLLGFSATLIENEELEQDVEIRRTCLQHIYEQSVRLEKLVSEMMYASRLQARNFPIRMSELDLAALVRDLEPMLRATTDRGSVELFLELPSSLINLTADPALLRQLIVNLVEASLATTTIGGWVSITLSADEGNAILTVTDSGTGIPAERLDRVFEPFSHYASLPSSAAGAGLGLSIARDIVDLHHGFITADSKVGEGTTITVVLPRTPA